MTDTLNIDQNHIWHPYSSFESQNLIFEVESASGVRIKLSDGRELIDGMASWWSVIHGYNNPELNQAAFDQIQKMSHVMFGGLTHEPAANLTKKLVELTPDPLTKVFLSDSGSVSVEVALKMAVQYWQSQGKGHKNKMLSFMHGYHGDTFGAMSVTDPINGMHHLFSESMTKQFFAPAPPAGFSRTISDDDLAPVEIILEKHHQEIAGLIIEPIVQGAGGMRFYAPEYLRKLRKLCDQYNVLLILDEIATGFGRSGELFAANHADISPDIMTLGKNLTGGYMSLAATLCTDRVARGICEGEAGVFMHGPTFMGNPLACAVANKSLELLIRNDWRVQVSQIERTLKKELALASELESVTEVRVQGAIGVIEMKQPVNMNQIQQALVQHGIWLRPFGKLIYMMPPYVITETDLIKLCTTTVNVIKEMAVS